MKRRGSAPDLTVLPVDGDVGSVPAAEAVPTGWAQLARILAVAFGLVATAALVVIAWGQVQQQHYLRHQQCVADAQLQAGFGNGVYNGGAVERALSRCFSIKQSKDTLPPILVPGFVSVRLGDAKVDIDNVGLVVGAVHGPTDNNSLVTDQEPKGGESVPPGSSVDLWTKVG